MVDNPHGVRQLFKPIGRFRDDYNFNPASGDSKRWDIEDPPMNQEFTAYFRAGGCDDTVSCKLHGGRHTDDNNEEGCCYIPQFPTGGGEFQYQIECPHPDNHDCNSENVKDCRAIDDGGWVGYKVVIWNTDDNCVRWVAFQDFGDSGDGHEPNPANDWQEVAHAEDCTGNCGNIDEPLLEPKGNSSQSTWRIDECGMNEDDGKFISVVEIDPEGGTGGGGTDPDTPEGEPVPTPDQPSTTIFREFVDVWHVAQDSGEYCSAGGITTPAELEDLWDVQADTPAAYFDLFNGSNTAFGILIWTNDSRLNHTTPKEWNFPVVKFGTPTGNFKLLWYDMGAVELNQGPPVLIKQIGADQNIATLVTGTETTIQIEDLDNEETIENIHAIVIEFTGGDASNFLRVRQTNIDVLDSSDTMVAYRTPTNWVKSTTRDLPWKIRGYRPFV